MSTVGPTATAAGRRPPAGLALAVIAIVLGILGMHGLATHGVVTGAAHDMSGVSALPPMSGHSMSGAAMSGAATASPATADSVLSVGTTGGRDHHDMGTMVMLCAAMLAGGAGLLLLVGLALRQRPRPWATLCAPGLRGPLPSTLRLGTGPPPVWQFSVIRC